MAFSRFRLAPAVLVAASLLSSCSLLREGKGVLATRELDELEMVIDAVERASDETKLTLLAAGMGVMAEDHWRVGSCGQAFEAMAHASAETKQTLIAASFEGCDHMCPDGRGRELAFESIAVAPGLDKTRILVAACDARGPEPVFDGEVLDRREQMDLVDFWVYRAMFAITKERLLDDIGSERAVALWERYATLRDQVAEELVLHLPPRTDGLELPSSDALAPARVATTVLVTPHSIYVDGESIASLTDLQLADSELRGQLILPLSDALAAAAERLEADEAEDSEELDEVEVAPPSGNPSAGEGAKARYEEGKVGKKGAKMARAKGRKVELQKARIDHEIAENAGVLGALRDGSELDGVFGSGGILGSRGAGAFGGASGGPAQLGEGRESHRRLLLQCDRNVSAKLLRQLLYTARNAEFGEVQLAVLNEDRGQQSRIDIFPQAVTQLPSNPYPHEEPQLLLVVGLDSRGITVAGQGSVLTPESGDDDGPTIARLPNGEYDYAELTRLANIIKDQYPDDELVVLVASDEVPYEAVTQTLDAMRADAEQGYDGRARTLFPYVVVSTEAAMPSPPARQLDSSGHGGATGGTGARVDTLSRQTIILGALEMSLVDAVVQRHKAQIQYCYERELKSDPSLAGRVVVKFVVAKDGSVSSATTKSSTMGSPAVEGCINGRFMRMRFPEPKGGGIVIVSYPFLFSPG